MSYDAMSTVEARGHRSMGGRAHLPGNFFNFQVVAGPRCGDVRRFIQLGAMFEAFLANGVVRFTFSIAQRSSQKTLENSYVQK